MLIQQDIQSGTKRKLLFQDCIYFCVEIITKITNRNKVHGKKKLERKDINDNE